MNHMLFTWVQTIHHKSFQIISNQILMYENSHVTIYGYIEAWTYHPMLNISVIPQRRYNLAPSVFRKLYDSGGVKVASVTSWSYGILVTRFIFQSLYYYLILYLWYEIYFASYFVNICLYYLNISIYFLNWNIVI